MADKWRRKRNLIMTENKVILSRGYPLYIYDCIFIAKHFDSKLILNSTPEGKFYVIIEHVFMNTMPHTPIQGLGITIEDAANDYMRQARGVNLIHVGTDKTGNFI